MYNHGNSYNLKLNEFKLKKYILSEFEFILTNYALCKTLLLI